MLHHRQRQAKRISQVNEEEGVVHEAVSEHIGDGGHEAEGEGEKLEVGGWTLSAREVGGWKLEAFVGVEG